MRRETDVLEQIRRAAVQDARRLQHGWLGVEHLFLAILRIDGGATVRALQAMGHDARPLRRRVREHVGPGTGAVENPPLTPRADRVLQAARLLAEQQNSSTEMRLRAFGVRPSVEPLTRTSFCASRTQNLSRCSRENSYSVYLWYRIISSRVERMAAADAFDSQPSPFEETVLLDSLVGVMGTGGDEAATRG